MITAVRKKRSTIEFFIRLLLFVGIALYTYMLMA